MNTMNRISLLLGCWIAAGIVMGTGSGCSEKKQQQVQERSIRVTLSPLMKRVFRHQIPVQGTVEPVEHAVISAKISGTLELLKVSEGDQLKTGETLFGIDRQILKNQVTVRENEVEVQKAVLASSRIALENAQITLQKAQSDYERFQALWESNATSKAEFEIYETAFKQAQMDVKDAEAAIVNAEAQLRQAEGNLVIAQKNLADSVVKAPFDCIITDKYVEEYEYVSVGQNILKLENPEEMEVVCYISAAAYYSLIEEGKTQVRFLDGTRELGSGVVTYKAPSIDPESRTFKLKIKVPPEIVLVSGTLCDLSIILEEKEAYGLPADAVLQRAGDRYIAYAVDDDNRAKSFDVTRGIVDGSYVEVVNAAELMNERFVITGQTFVNNGALLQAVGSK